MSLYEPGIEHRKQLTRGISVAGAMVLVINSVIGAGIYQLLAAVYPEAVPVGAGRSIYDQDAA